MGLQQQQDQAGVEVNTALDPVPTKTESVDEDERPGTPLEDEEPTEPPVVNGKDNGDMGAIEDDDDSDEEENVNVVIKVIVFFNSAIF